MSSAGRQGPRRIGHAAAKAAVALWLLGASSFGAGCYYAVPTQPADEPFDFEADRFAFANETVWHYVDGQVQPEPGHTGGDADADGHADAGGNNPSEADARQYTRRCFVMSRSALQFWKFARFEPNAEPVDEAELIRRIREVRRHSPAAAPMPESGRVVFPGYENLHQLTAAHPNVFQEHLGSGWATYFRPANHILIWPAFGAHQQRLHDAMARTLDRGHPFVLWLANFPSLDINHVVLVYEAIDDEPVYRYKVYDPNDAKEPKELTYDPRTREFSFQETFYFEGGSVTARAVYKRRRLPAPGTAAR